MNTRAGAVTCPTCLTSRKARIPYRTRQFQHPLQITYVTHLIEDGWDPLFVQKQVGHSHAATTGLYTWVGSDFRNQALRSALDATIGKATAPRAEGDTR
jgi:site-specific recombinase XerD